MSTIIKGMQRMKPTHATSRARINVKNGVSFAVVASLPVSFETCKIGTVQSRLSKEQPSELHEGLQIPSPSVESEHPGGTVAGVLSASQRVSFWKVHVVLVSTVEMLISSASACILIIVTLVVVSGVPGGVAQ